MEKIVMLMEMYSMYDAATEEYDNPILFRNKDIAEVTILRELVTVQENGKPIQKQMMLDAEFYYLGQFDTKTAKIYTLDEPQLRITGREFVMNTMDSEEDNGDEEN